MNSIKINEKEYTYPESMEELTLGMWEDIQSHVKSRITDKYSYEDVISILEIITGIEKGIFLSSPVQLFNIVFETCKWIFEISFEGIKPKTYLEIDDKKYTYGRSENVSLREWVDIDTILSKFPDNKKFSGILAVRMRENDNIYSEKESEQIEERILFWKERKAMEVMPIVNYFILKDKLLYQNFMSYSMGVQISLQQMEHIKHSLKNGDGIIRFAKLRKKILKKLIPYLETQSMKCLHSWQDLRIRIMQYQNQQNTNK